MRTLTTAFAFLALSATTAFAWNDTGHRVTGAIAANFLTPQAKVAITDILGPETLAEASTWPDFMRSSPDPFWQKEAGPYHYVTVPKGKTYTEAIKPPEGDAVIALAKFKAILQDPKASKADKQRALRFTVHIIGDLQQPLHAGDGTDRGGNDFLVTWDGEVTNLHAVWDDRLLVRENLSYTEWTNWLMARITPELAKQWSVTDPAVWIDESTAIRDTIYPTTRALSFKYSYDTIAIVRTRLSQGGVRMAAYLNEVFAAK